MKTILSVLTVVLVFAFSFTTASCGSSNNHLVSIAVTPNPANIASPGSVQLIATGTFSNGNTQVLSSADWTSSSPDITVNGSGLAACSIQGGPVIQATVTASVSQNNSMRTVSGKTTVFCTPPGV